MTRQYDSSRRRAQAQDTKQRVLDAAVALHRQGVIALEPLAAAAGVSLATVRKLFPNREALFEGCTRHFAASFVPPALDDAARIAEPTARVDAVVTEVCRAHEQVHDLVWHSAPLAAESAALAAAIGGVQAFVERAVAAVFDGRGLGLRGAQRFAARARLRALLDPLTYRAFRVHAGLDAATTQRELLVVVFGALGLAPL